jgi:osmoprotectant transport system ATP-binding protein
VKLRRQIGYVIQNVGLFPHQSVAANVATVPRLLGWDRQRQAERTDELLALVGLEPAQYRARYPAQLSGGERQRVGVARALAADPPLMLMDEPFGAVDPIARERLQNELLRLQDQLAKTILFVTHDIDEAIKMGDLVAVMRLGGRLAQFGSPEEILTNPASDFVARFVGADRGLKRLSLTRVGELELEPAVTARVGDDAADARARTAAHSFHHLLLLDEHERPLGWVHHDAIAQEGALGAELAEPPPFLLEPRTTLKDALSMLLAADVMAGVVVDGKRRLLGLVTVEQITATLRRGNGSSGD